MFLFEQMPFNAAKQSVLGCVLPDSVRERMLSVTRRSYTDIVLNAVHFPGSSLDDE